jgi:restriction endonuclease S subunit
MGYTFRGSLKAASNGNTAIVQMKDASPEGVLQPETFARTQITHLSEHYLLRPGDLIFRSRGLTNTTVLITQELARTVCIAPLMVIRVLPSQWVLPGYLHWYINLSSTQERMNAYARGTTIRMISAESMEGLEIVVPPMERQQKIVAAMELEAQIQALETKLAEKRHRYTEEALLLYAKEAIHPACV